MSKMDDCLQSHTPLKRMAWLTLPAQPPLPASRTNMTCGELAKIRADGALAA